MSWVRTRVIAAALGAAGLLALTAPGAHAGPISDGADCTAQASLTQAFLPWVDPAHYALSPDGGMENGAAGWSLSGGATTVVGNESHYVGDSADSRSLRLPSGSSATSAPTCVGLQWPTIRFFARSSSAGLLSLMAVEVVVDDALSGSPRAVLIGIATPGSSWKPSLPMTMVVNTLGALTKDGMLPVAFRFTPIGSGTWQVDDLYVDPWRGP
jgi:hypothetical protein